jgi:hypothetical protein
MKPGPILGVNIAHNTASGGYQAGELDDDSTPVSRPLNIAHNTLPQVFARMGLLPLLLFQPSAAYGSTAARVKAFVEQGGGCRATFFNYRRRLGGSNRTGELLGQPHR